VITGDVGVGLEVLLAGVGQGAPLGLAVSVFAFGEFRLEVTRPGLRRVALLE